MKTMVARSSQDTMPFLPFIPRIQPNYCSVYTIEQRYCTQKSIGELLNTAHTSSPLIISSNLSRYCTAAYVYDYPCPALIRALTRLRHGAARQKKKVFFVSCQQM